MESAANSMELLFMITGCEFARDVKKATSFAKVAGRWERSLTSTELVKESWRYTTHGRSRLALMQRLVLAS